MVLIPCGLVERRCFPAASMKQTIEGPYENQFKQQAESEVTAGKLN
jgi:hypothetical protein